MAHKGSKPNPRILTCSRCFTYCRYVQKLWNLAPYWHEVLFLSSFRLAFLPFKQIESRSSGEQVRQSRSTLRYGHWNLTI